MRSGRTRVWVAVLVAVATGALTPFTPLTPAAQATPISSSYVARDLGTLGGAASGANDVDGPIVVGDSETSQGDRHAFSFNLALPDAVAEMQDLGTLGGQYSSAAAVSGTIAVGQSNISRNGPMHGFAVNVATPFPSMIDLGTLGGSGSDAMAVSGTIVVGEAATPHDATSHAFAYDLATPWLGMRDLHTFGSESIAVAVDGTVIVGTAGRGPDARAFAYDLTKPEQGMLDLGTLGGSSSQASDVSGHLVTGVADLPGNTGVGAFVYDLDHPEQGMRNLGTLYEGNDATIANAISGTVVVGNSNPPGDHSSSAFAYDLSNPDQGMINLGGSVARGVDGPFVVGDYGDSPSPTGFVFDLRDPSAGPQPLPSLGGTIGGAVGNVEGAIVVGYSSTEKGQSFPYHAVAWRVDASVPVLDVSPPPTVDATSPLGASVAFTAAATDAYDDSPRTFCSKASGSRFAIGSTRVSCRARNWAGSLSTAQSFVVQVRGAVPQLQSLLATVDGLGLNTADATALTTPLDAAIRYATAKKNVAARRALAVFQWQVARLVTADHLPATTARSLNSTARRISAVLG